MLAKERLETFHSRQVGFQIDVGTADVNSTAFVVVPVDHEIGPVSFGDLMIRLQLSKRGALVVGVREPSGKEVINPPKSFSVKPRSLLIYLAKAPLLKAPD